MFQCIAPVIDYKLLQNELRTKKVRLEYVTDFLPYFGIICDLLPVLNRPTATWNNCNKKNKLKNVTDVTDVIYMYTSVLQIIIMNQ